MTELLVVVGPTASGKSALGAELAERLDGEVVSADAFSVYRGLDTGTAKPGPEVRSRVPHHLIDIADPRERYSAHSQLRNGSRTVSRKLVPMAVPSIAS